MILASVERLFLYKDDNYSEDRQSFEAASHRYVKVSTPIMCAGFPSVISLFCKLVVTCWQKLN
jgi:hypothetical protein